MAKISFCGISGSGMSSLAQIMQLSGNEVRGSDRSFDMGNDSYIRETLQKNGIKIFPQDGSAITEDLDFICASTAVEASIPDIKYAKEKNIPIKIRPQLLAEIFHSRKFGVAVGGTSGKTTTTAMIGFILDKAGKKPCMINGGLLIDYENMATLPNIIFQHGDICVVEADESNGSIDLYNPYISVINNISADHKSLEELTELFQNFANRTSRCVVINDDYTLCKRILTNTKTLSFSLKNPHADFYAHNIEPLNNGTRYCFRGNSFTLNLIGAFNVANALAAIAVCSELEVDPLVSAQILQDFHGTKRRLEIIGTKNNITVIDDFAHNPDKIRASISALKQYDGRLIVMFQPHGFTPMRTLGKEIMTEFYATMSADDILIMPEIFFAGGSVTKDVSSQDLISYAQNLGMKNAIFTTDKAAAAEKILSLVKAQDRIIIMGARDNTLTDLCRKILERL